VGDSSKSKTLFVARESIREFFRRHRNVYFITFTEPGRPVGVSCWTKDEAEAAFKPFRDRCSREGVSVLVVWERQQRGSWHPHCLVSKRFDAVELRSWMTARGWGPQMKMEWVSAIQRITSHDGRGGPPSTKIYAPQRDRVCNYLTKYLTKSIRETEGCLKKKVFGGSRDAKAGCVNFKWVPWEKAGAFLFAAGLEYFIAFNGTAPKFREMMSVIRLGVEATGWASVDPLWEFGFPSG
jgi:hypothetical protein